MSNGYGYKGAVSPANTAGWGGYGYGAPYPGMGMGAAPAMGMGAAPAMGMGAGPMMGMPAMPQTAVAGVQSPQAGVPAGVPSGAFVTPQGGNIVTVPVVEESYVENIIRLNRGKMATFYMTYENNREWNAKIFKGIIEAAGRDHIIISDPTTGKRFLLLMLNLDYVEFEGPINYEYTFQGVTITNTTPVNGGTHAATTLPAMNGR
ncbi:spore coat protein GerQ [Paenibacillus methanolicus]|uniref:Spore germination protein Q n=1 Tax=Paenibacillus methanolicus TaxID=582686 RepID=A0A5S5BYF6_9BACL|nr:spore coat protein GerQ [Paenibacillus methanolicus]TYP71368.1 spore germination protein Q [Paenibacillus methanolicus]